MSLIAVKIEAGVRPSSIRHKVSCRLSILDETILSLARKQNLSRMRVSSLLDLDARKARPETYDRVATILGVPVSFLLEEDTWDGLLSAVPPWLKEAKEKEEREERELLEKELKKIEKAKERKRKKIIRRRVNDQKS